VAHGHTASTEEQEEETGRWVTPNELSCPISFELMTDPVVADDGHTYQRYAIEEWIYKCTSGKESEMYEVLAALTKTLSETFTAE
jgi:hypothetical protein